MGVGFIEDISHFVVFSNACCSQQLGQQNLGNAPFRGRGCAYKKVGGGYVLESVMHIVGSGLHSVFSNFLEAGSMYPVPPHPNSSVFSF